MTAGTVLDRSRIPLTAWFAAAWYMTHQKHGVSALGLQRLLGLGSYQTAWTMLQKLRTAMVRPGRDRLHGPVEVDEAYVGGIEQGVRGRGTECKFIVAIAVEVLSPKGFGRIRLARVDDVSGASLVPFVSAAVEPGTEVRTDGWKGYNGLSEQGYRHHAINLSASGSGRTMARTRLRMMLTFPSSPLSVGSRSGAVSLRFSLPGAPRFLWDWTH